MGIWEVCSRPGVRLGVLKGVAVGKADDDAAADGLKGVCDGIEAIS